MIQVKIFVEKSYEDLERKVNSFLSNYDDRDIVDIKYDGSASWDDTGDVKENWDNAMIIYRE